MSDTTERLDWDSAFFGLTIARVTPTRATSRELASAVRWACDASVDCLYFLADADDDASVRAAEENGFSLVDVRLTLERPVSPDVSEQADAAVRPATLEDLPILVSIARVSHRNTRFHRDGRFDAQRADEMYAVWIERAVKGELADAAWVVDVGSGPVGYLTVSRDGACALIGLVAVDPSSRGLRYGERLVGSALRWAAGKRLGRLVVRTQGHEARAVRFYERAGFTTSAVQFWYHYWSGRD